MERNGATLSVVMAVYNQADYLALSIESILQQTYKDFEFIIIDDGSTDATLSILKAYAQKDSRIKLYSQENQGLTKSLNRALKCAKGRYIARQDADDLSHPERLQKQIDFLEKKPFYVLVSSAYEEIDVEGKKIKRKKSLKKLNYQNLRKEIACFNPIAHSAAMFRAFDHRGKVLYDESFRYAQDYALWVDLLCQAQNKAFILPDCLLKRREGPDMISSKKRREQLYFSIRAKLRAWKIGLFNPKYYLFLFKDCFVWLFFKKSPRDFLRFQSR